MCSLDRSFIEILVPVSLLLVVELWGFVTGADSYEQDCT